MRGWIFSLIETGITVVNSGCNVYKNIDLILNSAEYKNACKNLKFKYLRLHWKIFFAFAKFRFTFGVVVLLNIIVKLMMKN